MAKKKQPVIVTITKGKPHAKYRPNQLWEAKYKPTHQSPTVKIGERYTRLHSCKVGAVRSLGGVVRRGYNRNTGRFFALDYRMQDGREIQFVVNPKGKK